MTLVQMRFPDEHLFHTHPLLMMLTLCSFVVYSLAFSLELLVLRVSGTHHDDICPRNWSIMSGSLCLASLLGVLFSPHSSSWPWLPMLLCLLLLMLLAFAPKLVALVPSSSSQRIRLSVSVKDSKPSVRGHTGWRLSSLRHRLALSYLWLATLDSFWICSKATASPKSKI
ncbi:hypothetical protein Pyn_34694 [Prunus yedoensis var. nudiflora]|uniref:Uncharacterized protein n=1 Tax=Prunus yedoensis var. nudiflora TaxID=2094558 RepID=A0A314YDQ6_PRUYE|nr:hypothetical protein Pyn_34694 [Prunus yedoensis var. nudiflora]